MVRLNTRVETIHELLEKLLDDDSDMKDINLTAKQLVCSMTLPGWLRAFCDKLMTVYLKKAICACTANNTDRYLAHKGYVGWPYQDLAQRSNTEH